MKRKLTILTCFIALCSFAFGQNHWEEVNIHQYEGAMNEMIVVQINGNEEKTSSLEIGAFIGDELRGVSQACYQINQQYVYFCMIYGNANESNIKNITFKLFDGEMEYYATGMPFVFQGTPSSIRTINFFTPVAEVVGGDKYATLQEAIDAATEGQTVKLLTNIQISNGYNDKEFVEIKAKEGRTNITLDLNNYTISQVIKDNGLSGVAMTVRAGQHLTITDNSTEKGGKISACSSVVQLEGELTLAGGTLSVGENPTQYEINPETGFAYAVWMYIKNNATQYPAFNMTGGKIEIAQEMLNIHTPYNYANAVVVNDYTAAYDNTKVNIEGGEFNGTIVVAEGTETTGSVLENMVLYRYDANDVRVAKTVAEFNDAFTNESEFKLGANIQGSGVVIDKDITIDFGGFTYTFTSPAVGSEGTKTLGFQILKDNTVTLQNGTLNVAEDARTAFAMLIQNYADLTITNMTLDGDNLDRYTIKDYDYSYVLSNNSGEVSIKGETNIIANPGDPTCEKEHRGIALDACKYSSYAAPIVTVNTTGEIKGIVEVSATLNLEAVGTNNISSVDVTGEGQLYNNIAIAGSVKRTFENDGDENTENDWYTIAVPFAEGHTTSALQTTTDYALYRYNESNIGAEWENVKVNSFNLDLGRGYIYANANNTDVVFTGTFNHESKSFKVTATDEAGEIKGFNLVGNPFSHDITFANLSHTSLAQGFYVLEGDGSWVARNNAGTIKAFQGALIQVGVGGEGNDLTINKNTAKSRSNGDVNGSLAINVANSKYSDVAYVSFNEGLGLTKISHRNAEVPMVYVPVEGKNYAVATMSNDVEEIPFSFEAKTMGQYTISIDAEDSDFARVILVDRLTGEETNMLFEDYTFMAKSNDNPERFVLKLTSKSEMNSNNDDFVYIYKNELFISSTADNAVVEVYDVLGRPVATYNVNGSTNISMDNFSNGVYIVRMIEENDVKVQKILID